MTAKEIFEVRYYYYPVELARSGLEKILLLGLGLPPRELGEKHSMFHKLLAFPFNHIQPPPCHLCHYRQEARYSPPFPSDPAVLKVG